MSHFQFKISVWMKKRKSIDINIKMTKIVELSDKDFKAVIIRMLMSNYEHSWINEKIESLNNETEMLSKEIGVIKKNHMEVLGLK